MKLNSVWVRRSKTIESYENHPSRNCQDEFGLTAFRAERALWNQRCDSRKCRQRNASSNRRLPSPPPWASVKVLPDYPRNALTMSTELIPIMPNELFKMQSTFSN